MSAERERIERLEARVERQRRQLDAVAEIDRTIAVRPDPDHVLQRIVEQASKLMRADGAGIALVRPEIDELEVGPAIGVLEAPLNRRIPLYGSITGRAVRTGLLQVIPDVREDPEQYPLAPEPVPTHSAVVAPLRTPDELMGGLLVVRGPDHPPFDDAQADALRHFADQAAIAIEQARLVDRLRDANRAKENFLATLSHELRTPLTGILLWTDMLEADPLVAEAENAGEAVEVITQSAEQLLSMVNDLLELSRVEADKLRLEPQPVDLTSLARQALASFRRRSAEEDGVELTDALPDRLPAVQADPQRMLQVISNVISNAIKFTEPPGGVVVRGGSSGDGDRVALEVADTGIGIPADVLPHIFERFRQGEGGPTRRHGGLGVGLTVAQAIVEAHHGAIGIESEEGEGSTVTIELPALTAREGMEPPAHPVPTNGCAAEPARGRGGSPASDEAKPTVLVAEDVDETRQALAMILGGRGYRVLEALDGERAVAIAREKRPAAILMDIAMPGVDGISALERLRREPSTAEIPVAAVTARAMPDDRRRVEEAGFDAFLVKPFHISELLELMGRLLRSADSADR